MKRGIAVLLTAALLLFGLCGAYAETGSAAYCLKGVAYIERMGIGFSLGDELALRNGDVLESKMDSQIGIHLDGAEMKLNESSVISIDDTSSMSVQLQEGELFAEVEAGRSLTLDLGGRTVVAEGAVLLADVHSGSASVNLLSGSASAEGTALRAGEAISFSGDMTETIAVSAESMNAFALEQILSVSDGLSITHDQAENVIAQREEEISRAREEQAAHDAEILAQGGTEKAEVGTAAASTQTDGSGESTELSCTIEIRCNTILNNMQDLTEGKNAYVPANGVILGRSKIAFSEGETVFDVLKRACNYAGIQLEYSWTPMYGSYYIEGINHLYEFDCGEQSGWMYKVNGWFPNYGCSSYNLKGGDTIVWCYTCKGLGADVGGSVY